jgi:ribose transport system permease protein
MHETWNLADSTHVVTSAGDASIKQSAPHRSGRPAGGYIARYGLLSILGLQILFFSLNPRTSDAFLTMANWRTLVGSQAVLLLTALSFTLPLIADEFDLSSGGVVVFCGVLFAGLSTGFDAPITGSIRLPVLVALAVTVLVGAFFGAFNGVLVNLGVPSLITTLGTTIVLAGLVTWYTGGQSIVRNMPSSLKSFGTQTLLGLPISAWAALAIAVVVWYLLQFTPYGRRLHAIGSNRTAATFVGIRVPRCLLFSFIGAGVLAGFAGALLTARQGGGVSTNGLNLVLPAFAGTFLGATTIRPGHYNVFGTIIGLMFVAVSVNGLNLMGIDVWIQPVFNGLALILAVLISGLLHRRVSGRTS